MSRVMSKDRTEIAYERRDSGPAVILAGGALDDGSENAELVPALAENFTADSPTEHDHPTARLVSPVRRTRAANPSSVPGQCARTASRPARRTTLRRTMVTIMASSA